MLQHHHNRAEKQQLQSKAVDVKKFLPVPLIPTMTTVEIGRKPFDEGIQRRQLNVFAELHQTCWRFTADCGSCRRYLVCEKILIRGAHNMAV